MLGHDRGTVHAGAETILANAATAHRDRNDSQHSFFGGEAAAPEPIRLPAGVDWSLADRMAQEKEAFGFYFSSHPTDRYRHLAQAHGARSFADGARCRPRHSRRPMSGAAVRRCPPCRWPRWWRMHAGAPRRGGGRYLMATCSDATGQFIASCFDDDASARIEEVAKVGGCGLLSVELDRKPGEEMPRVTIRNIRPFEGMTIATRLRLDVALEDSEGVFALAALLADARRAGRTPYPRAAA